MDETGLPRRAFNGCLRPIDDVLAVLKQSAMRYVLIILFANLSGAFSEAKPSADPRLSIARLIAYKISGHANLRRRSFLFMLAPQLRAAVQTDMASSKLGALDYDPICQCQDNDGLRMRVVSFRVKSGSGVAVIENTFSNGKLPWVTLHLLETHDGWQIADIATRTQPSLLRQLKQGNRTVR